MIERDLVAPAPAPRRDQRGEGARRAVRGHGVDLERPGRPAPGAYLPEDGDTRRVLLGWDAARYGVEVTGPSCSAVDRAVAALAPPPTDALPA